MTTDTLTKQQVEQMSVTDVQSLVDDATAEVRNFWVAKYEEAERLRQYWMNQAEEAKFVLGITAYRLGRMRKDRRQLRKSMHRLMH